MRVITWKSALMNRLLFILCLRTQFFDAVNYLLIENLRRYDYFFGDSLKVECPTGSGKMMRLTDVAHELSLRLSRLFYPSPEGFRPCHGEYILIYTHHGENSVKLIVRCV